ncbi:16S rRNA (uracil(1498)-N(3))-methyltransferase [Ideonella sp.]|jgi:16S rRNA (uracil1498-N3)-methyltransferase|uniref:16S rRNA (uracil(1498)-N(3))-methyltransferase n=1 Tax=Ideonella sp. TaxID=1929293 RepID=UPI0037C06AC2
MPPRLYLDAPLHNGAELTLPADASRHIQVLRLQPGDALTLFNGQGGEWAASVTRMGRQDADVRVEAHHACSRELPVAVSLALGMPANERMDALVEKAAELGAVAIQPLHSARSVLRLHGERAERRRSHWQGVAQAAAEQSGRTTVPHIAPVQNLADWLASLSPEAADGERLLLSFAPDARPLSAWAGRLAAHITLLSGPEGGLDAKEEALARSRGFVPLSLGPRVLRADTAPLATLAGISALCTL